MASPGDTRTITRPLTSRLLDVMSEAFEVDQCRVGVHIAPMTGPILGTQTELRVGGLLRSKTFCVEIDLDYGGRHYSR